MMFESDSVPFFFLSPSPQIIQTSTRICRALVFYFSQRPSFPPDVREGDLLLWVLSLLRALQQRTWGDGSRALLQLVLLIFSFVHHQDGVGPTALHNLSQRGICDLRSVAATPTALVGPRERCEVARLHHRPSHRRADQAADRGAASHGAARGGGRERGEVE